MFDDLILLAKGGLTVYHGSVKKVEEYFASLGITVPERVNPPDYFIDILEGIVKLNTSTGLTTKQLPVRWMLHNGYPVPMDMLKSIEGMAASGENSAHGGSSHGGTSDAQSFADDFWQDVKCSVETKKDNLQHNILKSIDLSQRETPGVFKQYRYYLGRYQPCITRSSSPYFFHFQSVIPLHYYDPLCLSSLQGWKAKVTRCQDTSCRFSNFIACWDLLRNTCKSER